jgi:electron transfer flavoprotein beta subunit
MSTHETDRSHTFLVCVKYTLDVEEIKVNPTDGSPNLELASYRINDFDENGIEAALKLRDDHGGRVLALSVMAERPPDNVLLRALAMGVDELHLVCDSVLADCDAMATASILAALVGKLGPFDLLVCSDTSVDEYRGEVGPRLAEELRLPSVTHITEVVFADDGVRADRVLESWLETVEVTPPALLTVGSETNDPRLPTLRQIRHADRKPIVEWRLADLVPDDVYGDSGSRIETLALYAPPSVRKRVVVTGEDRGEVARKLVDHLLEDAAIRL